MRAAALRRNCRPSCMPRARDPARRIRTVCVYCGSAGAVDERYRAAAAELGRSFAAAGIGLVFGGGRIGLMGVAADAALAAGGRVVGVIPAALHDREVAHQGLSELVIVDTMHDRKRIMAERSDAFAVLPGGIGTLDEFFEILTWRQLLLHNKPIFGGRWARDHKLSNPNNFLKTAALFRQLLLLDFKPDQREYYYPEQDFLRRTDYATQGRAILNYYHTRYIVVWKEALDADWDAEGFKSFASDPVDGR